MATVEENVLELPAVDPAAGGLGLLAGPGREASPRQAGRAACFHCGQPCPDLKIRQADKVFCCHGCELVHDLLAENGLGEFYALSRHPGVRIGKTPEASRWAYLDEPAIQQRLLDFTDGKISRVTFHVPAIHCVACVWLLENLFRLHPGVGRAQVSFPRREVSVQFTSTKISLAGLAALLASIGYEPRLTLGELEKKQTDPAAQRRWLQLGVAGFAFGNIMLLTIPLYFGLDEFNGPVFRALFGWLSLALAAPVVLYSASDYWRSAWVAVRQRILTLDVPIALGLAALYAQSFWEIASGRGAGYLDSLVGLVFFLLCGRAFQQRTQDRMAFDRDYKCFFPLAVNRRKRSADAPVRVVPNGLARTDSPLISTGLKPGGNEKGTQCQDAAGDGTRARDVESVSISSLRVGDRLLVRNGELIPTDARLMNGTGCIDYSFVTGEAEPVMRQPGDQLYAGGKQTGETIEVETVKPVSQSYLTSLWNHDAFRQPRGNALDTLTNRYSRRFTVLVIAIAAGACLFWALSGSPARGLRAFISVLIVACPCALALAAPFALGTAQRLLARVQVFLKNTRVLEELARVDAVVFDKTGTLTGAGSQHVEFQAQQPLTESEARLVYSLACQSTHPHAVQIASHLAQDGRALAVAGFAEFPGRGLEATIAGHHMRLGSAAWLVSAGVAMPPELERGSASLLAVDGQYRGRFGMQNRLRSATADLLHELGADCELALLSGDNENEAGRFRELFGERARLHFQQSPLDKLNFIRRLQQTGKTVMMVGDGLNDAGALRQSDVGVAVVENTGTFSPASDVILEGRRVSDLHRIFRLARRSTRVVRFSFAVSAAYNLVGISIAASGWLSPLICAVLMPLSSVSVVLSACALTTWAARKEGLV